jgi:chondroitin AC lyase
MLTSVGWATFQPSSAAVLSAADTRAVLLVLSRLRAEFVSAGSLAQAAEWLNSQSMDGSWPDIDYANRSNARWPALVHLERTRTLAIAFSRQESALMGSPRALQAINRALDSWLQRQPTSTGWWQVSIGAPLELMRILTLTWETLDPGIRSASLALLHTPSTVPPERATGQNLVWYATQQVVRGALTGNVDDLVGASGRLQAEVVITEREGIQADMSFHQHSVQLYTGGYGLGFLMDSVRMASLLAGTPWAYTAAKLALLADYTLDGVRPLIRGSWLDWSTRGREFTRRQRVSRPAAILPSVTMLAALSPPRKQDLAGFAKYLKNNRTGAPVVGNRHFWRSDFMVHQRDAGYASARWFSARTVGSESGNEENLLGHWLPFGLTYLLRRGDEYDQLPAVWDWSRLPGVTSPAEVPQFSGLLVGGHRFAGGASDGRCGVAAAQFDRFETQAKKAWFFCGDLMLSLGADIACERPSPVATTINQTRLRGDIITNLGQLRRRGVADRLNGVRWLWHDGLTYLLPDGQDFQLLMRQATGTGQRINKELGLGTVSADVFMLTIEHGRRPIGERYAYGVWMGETAAPEASWVPPNFSIIENSPDMQCVHHQSGQVVQAVMHRPGTAPLGHGHQLTIDRPCIVQATRSPEGWDLALADPLQVSQAMDLELNASGQKPWRSVVEFDKSPGMGGRSASVKLTALG